MLSRKQKEQLVEEESKRLEKNKTLVLTNFAGLPVGKVNALRKSLKEIGATYRVIKKRLLGLVFQKHDVKLNPK
ncbi:MAG: 50S ribosomal protein L10, partial [Candidatus Wolfebacteria bacterium]|nr:50S ribosomal protein L10 [Candidatus Wolfebacteria bacterium]